MSNVVNLFEPRNGEWCFLRCTCKPEGVDYLVVTLVQSDGPLVCGLMCPACESSLPIVNGRVLKAEKY